MMVLLEDQDSGHGNGNGHQSPVFMLNGSSVQGVLPSLSRSAVPGSIVSACKGCGSNRRPADVLRRNVLHSSTPFWTAAVPECDNCNMLLKSAMIWFWTFANCVANNFWNAAACKLNVSVVSVSVIIACSLNSCWLVALTAVTGSLDPGSALQVPSNIARCRWEGEKLAP